MEVTELENLFRELDEAVILLQQEASVSYVEALAETIENLAFGAEAQQIEGVPSAETIALLNKKYRTLNLTGQPKERLRKAVQLAYIKATKTDQLQMNHQMTPDTIAFLLAHFTGVLSKKMGKKELQLTDLAAGTGNLLFVILDHLAGQHQIVTAEAVENDDLLIGFAANLAVLLGLADKIHFTHSDSLQDLLIDPSDFIIADLPVGYYPVNERAARYRTASKEGHSYAHYLLIEQSMKYLKEAGWGIFIVPADLFETEESPLLMDWLKQEAYLQALLSLPASLFHSEKTRKALLFIQKRGEGAQQAREVLLGEIPDLKSARKMQGFLDIFHNWSEKML